VVFKGTDIKPLMGTVVNGLAIRDRKTTWTEKLGALE
jgi:hypothetical protein